MTPDNLGVEDTQFSSVLPVLGSHTHDEFQKNK